jgi:hypothetical protein
MTPKQVETLSQLITDQLKSHLWERVGVHHPPIKPANQDRLFFENHEVKKFLEGHLRSMGVIP